MKNMKKLVALFAATVMTMSLSVSAFAAEVNTTVRNDGADITDNSFNLVFEAPTGGEADIDQMTMIAYLVPDTTTLETWVPYNGSQTIVAINQVGGDVGFGTVPVDVTKLTSGNSIAVAIGGTDVGAANIQKALITYSTAPQVVAYEITYELAGGTAEGNPAESNSEETIAEFFAKVTAPTQEGFTFLHWSKTADGEAINTASTEKMSTLLDADSTTTVTLYAVYETNASAISVTFMNGNEVVDTVATVDGKVVLTTKVPTFAEAEGTDYVAEEYTFVEWVTEDGAPVTAETPIDANTTVYAKYDTGVIYGDVDGNGRIRNADKTYIYEYIQRISDPDNSTGKLISSLSDIICGDVDGNGRIRNADKTYIYENIQKISDPDNLTGKPIYVINIAK